jgi:hypothetical protein
MRLEEMGYQNIFKWLKELIARGQVEITGSAAYHPILPLIPEAETVRQIRENEDWLARILEKGQRPRGFFLPELAYTPKVAELIKEAGYEWLILDEIAYNGHLGQADTGRAYLDENSGLKVVLRSRRLSRSYVPETITAILDKNAASPDNKRVAFALTAADGELVGLRHEDPTAVYERLLKRKDLETSTVSEWLDKQKDILPIKPEAHSWETTEAEMEKSEPFALWQDKTNTIQKKLWELADLAYKSVEGCYADHNYNWARWHLVRGLASCTFWWASARDFRLFSSLSWSPDLIERGVNELVRAIRALENEDSRDSKIKAEKLNISIKKMIWERHWVYHWKK